MDMLVVSHGDNDHIGGAEALLHALPVDRILTSVPERLPGSEPCVAGDNWVFDDVHFYVFGPDSQTPRGSNNRSCVIRINGNSGSILLTGDIEKEVEIDLVSRALPGSLRADVLLVPHQGSRTSSRPVFVEQVSPRLALVASGYLNSYGHPHAEVLARYLDRDVPVLNTADSGTITVTFLREGISWSEYRESHRRFWYRRRSPR